MSIRKKVSIIINEVLSFLLSLLFFLVLLGAAIEKMEPLKQLPIWGWTLLLGLALELALLISAASMLWHILAVTIMVGITVIFVIPALHLRWVYEPWLERVQESLGRMNFSLLPPIPWQEKVILGFMAESNKEDRSDKDDRGDKNDRGNKDDKGDKDDKKNTDRKASSLRPQEMDFLMEDCVALCQLWNAEIIKEEFRLDSSVLSPRLLRFLAARGFNRLELNPEYGGKNFSLHAMTAVLTKLACCDMRLAELIASFNNGLGTTVEKYGSSYQSKKYLSALATEESFIYKLGEAETRAKGGYGVVCKAKYHNRSQLGLQLHWRYANPCVPSMINWVGLIIPCYDPDRLLDEAQPELCILLPRELLKKTKQGTQLCDGFVPLSFVLGNRSSISFLRNAEIPFSLAHGTAYLLRLTHRLSAVLAARQWLGPSAPLSSLAALGYELSALLSARELCLWNMERNREEGRMMDALVKASISRATLWGIRSLGSFDGMELQPEISGKSLWTLQACLSEHSHWRAIVGEYAAEEKQNKEEERNNAVSRLFAHYAQSLLRCFALGLTWGWTARDPQTQMLRRLRHITAAFGLVMDMLLVDALVLMRPFPRCDRAWHSFYLLLALTQSGNPVAEDGWKTALHLCQYELKRLLVNRPGNWFFTNCLNWTVFPWGRNYDRPSVVEERSLAEKLMIPSQERQDLFEIMDTQARSFVAGEEMIKLAWLVKDIYADLRAKSLRRPWSSGELEWYKELCVEQQISPQDLKIMNRFYKQAMLFLHPAELG